MAKPLLFGPQSFGYGDLTFPKFFLTSRTHARTAASRLGTTRKWNDPAMWLPSHISTTRMSLRLRTGVWFICTTTSLSFGVVLDSASLPKVCDCDTV